MKKIVSSADLGGAPIYKSDLREIFNDEIWDALEALLSPFQSDTQGIIVSGCVFTNNAGNFDMTAGIVYLNGEFMRISAVTNQAFTKYIAPATPTNESRTFADLTTANVTETKTAELVGSVPGAGQYISISSLTSGDARKWSNILVSKQIATVFQSTLEALGGFRTEGSGAYIKTKIIQIGDWNMQSSSAINISHGITDYKKIRSITGIIINDDDSNRFVIGGADGDVYFPPLNGVAFVGDTINGTYIKIARRSSGSFDSADFDSTGFNRGYLTIVYEA